jgi:bile acid:Na+ symporter, BASS family
LVPLIFGIALHQLAPTFAERAAKPVAQVADVLLLIAVIPILIRVWPAVFSLVGNGTVLIMLVIAMLALASGHLLGGPDPDDRGVLALASSARHPGIAIAHLNFPDQKLAPAAVILYLLVSAIVTAPYLKWTARHHSHVPSAMTPSSA